MNMRITPNLWFDDQAEQAAEFYCSVFPNSRITHITRYTDAGPGPAGTPVTVDFELDGMRFSAINGGPMFTFTEAVSFAVECPDQATSDGYWDRLTDGGQASRCGWLKDRFGLSWQVYPVELNGLVNDPDPERAGRALTCMMGQGRIDVAAIRAAMDAPGEA